LPTLPKVFFKSSECVNDPCGAIAVPAIASSPLDAEVEQAVILNKNFNNVDEAIALD
jgi:2-keto-4-pentenoate hydratase/2-oxohepta-3-ene-1,7-dioic acid hydratase in catechol pathway